MNYQRVLKTKNQLINKCTELNACVHPGFGARALPRHSRALASRFGSRGEWRVNRLHIRLAPRHARECVNLALWVYNKI